jgi:oligoendopeptidase F
MRTGDREDAVKRYMTLLSSGGNDHPVRLLQKAGVDLTDAATVQSVVDQMATLVAQLEVELDRMGLLQVGR